jgi:hypothetical protein
MQGWNSDCRVCCACACLQVERSKGMVTEAGQHFTMAGDILLRHSNETSNSVNGDKSGTRGGKDMDGLASSDKLGSSASWPTASGAARCLSLIHSMLRRVHVHRRRVSTADACRCSHFYSVRDS